MAHGAAAFAEVEVDLPHTNSEQNPPYPVATKNPAREEFWRKVPTYRDVTTKDFLSYRWSVSSPHIDFPPSPWTTEMQSDCTHHR